MIKMPTLYRVGKFLLSPIYKLIYNPKIIGKENIPDEGSIVIASNHLHVMDQCNIIVSTKRFITYMAKDEYFKKKSTSWFFKGVGCIPVNRESKDEEATKSALKVLKKKGAIGIFPEGTRNKTSEFLLPFKYGAVSLAKKTDSLIIPVATTGYYKFRSNNLMVTIGKPIDISNLSLEEANDLLYKTISDMMENNLKETKLFKKDFRKKYDKGE